MKTRRILAASTAALLAFGSVAVVASAATSDVADASEATFLSDVKIELKDNADLKTVTPTAKDLATLMGLVNVTATAQPGVAESASGAGKHETKNIALTTADMGADKAYNITVTETSAKVTLVVDYKKTATSTKFDGSVSKSFDINYTAGTAVDIGKSEGGKLNLGAGVVASANKSGISKTFKDVKISAKDVEMKTVGSGDDITIDTENCTVIKGLKKDLREQFEDVKEKNIKILDIQLSDGTVVQNKAPGTVTIEVTTDFEPNFVYHVVDDEVEIITGATSSELVNSKGYKTTFTTTKFSPFILMKGDKLTGTGVHDADLDPDAVNGASSKPATSSGASSTTSGASTTNPNTGIALAIAPVVLAAGAVAVVALKKKH